MTWPTDLARQSTNPFSADNMISRNLMNQALKAERDRMDQQRRSYGSTSSSCSSAPDTPASRALDRRLANMDRRYSQRSANASSGCGFAEIFSACYKK